LAIVSRQGHVVQTGGCCFDPELLRGNVSQVIADFLFGVETGTSTYKQWSVDGFTTGDLFSVPAGEVGSPGEI
jgi:hypothetical protein